MQIKKYLKENYLSASGHEYELIAFESAQVTCTNRISMANVKLARFKDHDAYLNGLAPCPDNLKPLRLYANDLILTPLEIQNAIIEAIGKKLDMEVVEIPEEMELASFEEQAERQLLLKKEKEKKAHQVVIDKKVSGETKK